MNKQASQAEGVLLAWLLESACLSRDEAIDLDAGAIYREIFGVEVFHRN
jgi:hypothetical protein